jgi:Flp pilus assembly protein TadG
VARWRTRLRGSRAERGAAAVEFAIVLTVLLLILLGIIDFGRLLFVSQAVKSASREGARVAAVRTVWGVNASTDPSVLKAATDAGSAAQALSGGGPLVIANNKGVSTNVPLCPSPAVSTTAPVQVTVTATFRWLTPIGALPGLSAPGLTGTKPVSSTTTMRCE